MEQDVQEHARVSQKSVASAISISVLGLAIIGLMVSQLWVPLNVYDEGLVLVGADRVLAGEVIHADFWRLYPIGQFAAVAAMMSVFGQDVVVARVFGLVSRLVLVALLAWCAFRLAGRWTAVVVAVVSGIALGVSGAQLYSLHPAVAAALASLLILWVALEPSGGRGTGLAILAGALLGIAGLFRHDVATLAAIALLGSLGYAWWRNVSDRARTGRVLTAFTLAAAGTGGLVLGGIMLTSGPAATWDQLVRFPVTRMAAARGLPLPRPWPIGPGAAMFYTLVLALAVTAFWLLSAARRGQADGTQSDHRFGALALGLLTLGVVALALSRFDRAHSTPAALLAIVLVFAATRDSAQHGWRTVRPLVALAASVAVAAAYLYLPLRDLRRPTQEALTACAPEVIRSACVPLPADQVAAINRVRQLVPEGERIFVGVTTHSRVFVGDSAFYFLSDRLPATKYDEIHPGVTDTADIQRAIVADLEARNVRVVVRYNGPQLSEPNLSSVDSGVTILDDFIRAEFPTSEIMGNYEVLYR